MVDVPDPVFVFGDLAGEIGRNVYVSDPIEGYKLGKLVDFYIDRLKIKLIGSIEDVLYVPHNNVLPAEDDATKDVHDSCSLMYLNEGTLLNNCRVRYARKQIYTYVANILISINPYEVIPGLYSNENINLYHGKSLGTLPPHIFAIADKAHRELKRTKESQSIIVSGESGAGKTESQKYILRYLCDLWGATAGSIEQRLLDANPILEAFGNAKTIRNNNSSRFGKFVEIHFNKEYNVSGGFVSHYLLEKPRICHQNIGERNYHIFYQLIAGADDKLSEDLHLRPPEDFNYLHQNPKFFSNSETFSKISSHRRLQKNFLVDGFIDDYANFQTLRANLTNIGFDEIIQKHMFSIISGILHLGNVNFKDSEDLRGGCCIDPNSIESLNISAKLFGLDVDDFRRQLTSKVLQSRANVKGTVIIIPLKPSEAQAARDGLAKAIYTRLFDDIVATINKCIPSANSVGFIGVLDIAGFEFFENNSFEQFCINYCNEKLQQFFNEKILKDEQELYRHEALNVPEIEFIDNQDCIELFEARGIGLLDLLDEEARLPRGSGTHFTEEVHRHHMNNMRILPPRKSRLRDYRNMRDNEGFLIRHYAGAVCYQTSTFLEKNNDALHANLEMIIETSDNPYLKNLFLSNTVSIPSETCYSKTRTKIAHVSIASKFRCQLNTLLRKLRSGGTHFVRCIKPNSEMKPGKFEGAQILSQLKSSGMTSVLQLMHCGFPSRINFKDLYNNYQFFLPDRLKALDQRLFCRCLFYALGLSESYFQFGLTKAFFKTGKFAEFDQLLHQDKNQILDLMRKIQSWLNKIRWKKIQWTIISCLKVQKIILNRRKLYTQVQAIVRAHLTRRKVLSQLNMFKHINFLRQKCTDIEYLIESISNSNIKNMMREQIKELISTTENMKKIIKENPLKTDPVMSKTIREFDTEIKVLIDKLRDKSAVEEQKIEAVEINSYNQFDEQKCEKLEQKIHLADNRDLEVVHQQQEMHEMIHQLEVEKKEQELEYLDDELIRRIAREKDLALEETPKKKFKTESGSISISNHNPQNNELSKLTHAELRTILNTTNDLQLLKSCQAEFHRRLRFFNNWRLKHQKMNNVESKRNPESNNNRNLTKLNAKPVPPLPPSLLPKCPTPDKRERFFRTPLCNRKYVSPGALPEAGFWYAHFEGEFLIREILFRAKETPILMIAGRDDINMTHQLLSETELLKSNCEIKKNEFETAWTRFGGTILNK